jgi:hypothetical protein
MISFADLIDEINEVVPLAWEDDVPLIYLGPKDAKQKLYYDVGAHGQEMAGPLALRDFVQKYGKDWKWPNVQMLAVIVDAPGTEESGYGFWGVDGNASCWPPLWGYRQDKSRYWTYVDYNSTWGNMALGHLSPLHKAMRDVLTEYEPTFLLSAHETVENETDRGLFWPGCGIMVLEKYPISAKMYKKLIGIPNPAQDLLGFCGYLFRRWLTFITGRSRWHRNAKILAKNDDYALITEIVKKYTDGGNLLFGKKWQRIMELQGYVTTGLGRAFFGREKSDWMTVMDYAMRKFGIPTITTETFPVGEIGLVGVDWRKKQQLAFAEAVLDTLEEQYGEKKNSITDK